MIDAKYNLHNYLKCSPKNSINKQVISLIFNVLKR
jgi:hypothetical protein